MRERWYGYYMDIDMKTVIKKMKSENWSGISVTQYY